ncbi:MAG: type II secretion system F family protein [Opitutaceae bacterium]|nr:type II secretion system F family protein [Opitutaceae bacterium]
MAESLSAYRLTIAAPGSKIRTQRTVLARSRELAQRLVMVPRGGRLTIARAGLMDELVSRVARQRRPSGRDLRSFYIELRSALRADASLPSAFRTMAPWIENALLADAVANAIDPVIIARGSDAMLDCLKGVLPLEHVERLRAAVGVGETPRVVEMLAGLSERRVKLAGRLVQALLTPAITVVGALGAAIFIATVQAPAMAQLYAAAKAKGQLPVPTQILLFAVNAVKDNPLVALAVPALLGILVWVARRAYQQYESVQDKVDHLPVLGRLLAQIRNSRMLRTLAILIDSGRSVTVALAMTERSVSHRRTRRFLHAVHETIAMQGIDFFEAASQHRDIIGDVEVRWIDLLHLGAATGSTSELLNSVADDCEQRAEAKLDVLPKLLEFAALVIAASLVGFVVIASLLPTFRLAAVLK